MKYAGPGPTTKGVLWGEIVSPSILEATCLGLKQTVLDVNKLCNIAMLT